MNWLESAVQESTERQMAEYYQRQEQQEFFEGVIAKIERSNLLTATELSALKYHCGV